MRSNYNEQAAIEQGLHQVEPLILRSFITKPEVADNELHAWGISEQCKSWSGISRSSQSQSRRTRILNKKDRNTGGPQAGPMAAISCRGRWMSETSVPSGTRSNPGGPDNRR
jgi:hypothetical protein